MNADMMNKVMGEAPMAEGKEESPEQDMENDKKIMAEIDEFFSNLKEKFPEEVDELDKGYEALKAVLEKGEEEEATEEGGESETEKKAEGEGAPSAKTREGRHKIMISMLTGGKE